MTKSLFYDFNFTVIFLFLPGICPSFLTVPPVEKLGYSQFGTGFGWM
jgi:hypothetical protein